SGVRNLERELASLCRKSAKEIVLRSSSNGSSAKSKSPLVIDEKKVEEFLGVPKYRRQAVQKENRIGSTTGLAWTSVGGEILEVDVTIMPGQERLSLTGQLGSVMKDSAQAGLSYIRSNAKKLGIPEQFFKGKEIHIHLPEGAIPKDGPSAGITMVMAMLSAISGKPTSSDVAMTGEITLRGKVLPIGGLNEKLIAAKRSNISTVLIPKDNEIDLKEILPKVKDGLTIIPIEKIEQALPYVFKKTIVKKKQPVTKKKAITKKKK
ncbi:MAG: S16 family serine protease, partial [Ignavibacteria bacterium]|nr:S16 family serine protease [Ignavibacteria bacterium]